MDRAAVLNEYDRPRVRVEISFLARKEKEILK